MIDFKNIFLQATKKRYAEEWFDYYFFRRVAVYLLPLFMKMKWHPNAVTLLSLVMGLVASILVYKLYFVMGSFFLIVAIILDCADGMLARVTGKTGAFGRLFDGTVDLVWISTFWTATFLVIKSQMTQGEVIVMIMASISMIIHCWRFDAVKTYYYNLQESMGEHYLSGQSLQQLIKELKQQKKYLLAFFYWVISFQEKLFYQKKSDPVVLSESEHKSYQNLVQAWTFLGVSMHMVLVVLGVMGLTFSLKPVLCVFYAILFPLNFYWIYCELRWRRLINRSNS